MTKFYLPLWLMIVLVCFTMNSSASMEVQYSGCVAEEVSIFDNKMSLLKLLKQAKTKPCAYHFATALTQTKLIEAQVVQKEILLMNLQLFKLNADSEALKVYLSTLIALIDTQPVTGRVLGLELDSTRVEIIPLQNKVFQDAVKLHFPRKLKLVYFIGTEKREVLYRPAWTLEHYLKENPLLDFFEKGYVYVVQANTGIEKRKVGHWNHNDDYVSPGGWVVGLLNPDIISEISPSFNEDLAQWFATQVLP